jgi:LysM repeat protein
MSAIALGVGYLIGSVTSASASEGENVSVITVQPGDTLWSLAESVSEPGEDIRETILEIGEINGLTSSSIQAGQRLLLPSQP